MVCQNATGVSAKDSAASQGEKDQQPAAAVDEDRHERGQFAARALVEIAGPDHVAADRRRQHQVEKHADEVVTQEMPQRLLEAERPRQHLPAKAAAQLGHSVNAQGRQPQTDPQLAKRLPDLVPVRPPRQPGQ